LKKAQSVTGPPDQCFAAFLVFLPLCLALPAPFLVLPLIDFAPCLAFLATRMADSCVLGKGPANPGIGGARSRISALNATNGRLPSSTLDAVQTLRILLPRCQSPHWVGRACQTWDAANSGPPGVCPRWSASCRTAPSGRGEPLGEDDRVARHWLGGADVPGDARGQLGQRGRTVKATFQLSLSGGVTRYVWAGGTPGRLGGERGGLPLARTTVRRTCHSAALSPGVSGGCCRAHAEGRNSTLRPTRRILNPAQRTR